MDNEIVRVVFLGGFVDTTDDYETVIKKIDDNWVWVDFDCQDGSKHHIRIDKIIDVWRLKATNTENHN